MTLPSYLTSYGLLNVPMTISLDVIGDQNPTNFSSSSLPDGLTINSTTGQITGTPTEILSDPEVTVSFDSDMGSFNIFPEIRIANIAYPTYFYCFDNMFITIDPIIDASQFNTGYNFTVAEYVLPHNATINNSTGRIVGTISNIQNDVVVTISLNIFSVTTITYDLNMTMRGFYVAYASSQLYAILGEASSYEPIIERNTPDSFSVDGELPTGLSMDLVTGVISGTPSQIVNASPVTVFYTYGDQTFPLSLEITVTPYTINLNHYAIVGQSFTLNTNANNLIAEISSSNLPDGLSISTAGLITGIPTTQASYNVSIEGTLNADLSPISVTFNILAITFEWPEIIYLPGQFIYVGQDSSTFPKPFYPTIVNISPALPGSIIMLPEYVTYYPLIGKNSGSPTYTVTVEVPDGETYDIPLSFTETFLTWPPPVSVEYPIDSQYLQHLTITGQVGIPFNITPSFGEISELIHIFGFPYDNADFPDGISFNSETGQITGTPTTAGTYENILLGVVFTNSSTASAQIILTFNILEIECLHEKSLILTPKGYKPISTLKQNDQIISDNNTTRKIKNIHVMPFVGKLYCLPAKALQNEVPHNDVYLSGNHLYYYNNRRFKPKDHLPFRVVKDPINLYHIELDNSEDNIVVSGVYMESYKKTKPITK